MNLDAILEINSPDSLVDARLKPRLNPSFTLQAGSLFSQAAGDRFEASDKI
jgi:hypothetical protein